MSLPKLSAEKRFRSGVIWGAVASISYGTNPLFALPLYQCGFNADTILLFRYLPAAAMLAVLMLARREDFRLPWRELLGTAGLGMLFAFSSLTLFQSYRLMDVGIASTLLFIYPLLVALIAAVCFRERLSGIMIGSLLLAMAGVVLLCRTADGALVDWRGIVLVLGSSLSYALYLIWIGHDRKMQGIPAEKLTFFVLLFGSLFYAVRLGAGGGVQGNFSSWAWLNVAGVALIATALSMSATALALQRVGSTVTAVLGALEPLSAVFCGVMAFHERLSVRIGCGIVLILCSVLAVVVRKPE